MENPIRVLVVDDSRLMRKVISDILEADGTLEVVGQARDGEEAVKKVAELRPDVVTMDIEMPGMNGLEALYRIMTEHPTPVIMLSAMDKRQADITMKALDLGAVDFISKTSGTLSLDIDKTGASIVEKVRLASKARVFKAARRKEPCSLATGGRFPKGEEGLVVIGSSTGGPRAIAEILAGLPRLIPAGVIIVQHMPEGFTASFAERLNWCTSLEVKEAAEGDVVRQGLVLVAPGNRHLEVRCGRVRLGDWPKVNNVRPSIDVAMASAVEEHGSGCVGVLLTGMGNDGAAGMKLIKDAGGRTIAQDEATCVIFGMPKAAIKIGAADTVLPLDRIAPEIVRALGGRP